MLGLSGGPDIQKGAQAGHRRISVLDKSQHSSGIVQQVFCSPKGVRSLTSDRWDIWLSN